VILVYSIGEELMLTWTVVFIIYGLCPIPLFYYPKGPGGSMS